MKVEDIMIRNVKCCAPADVLNHAAQIMWENDCGCVPVVDDDSRTVGILTDRDICMAAYTQGRALKDIQVSSAMSREVFVCRSSDDLLTAQRLMRGHCVRRLPATDADGKLMGIVSLTDIARALVGTSTGKAQVATTVVAICAPHRLHGEHKLPDVDGELLRAESRRPRSRRTKTSTKGAPD